MNDSNASKKKKSAYLLMGDKQFTLSGSTFFIGRAPTNDLVLDDESISAHHAVIKDEGESFSVLDLNSTNGTAINGERVTTAKLTNNDFLVFGSVETIFQCPTFEPDHLPSQGAECPQPVPFSWWPQNKIVSFLAAVFFGILFIFNASVSPVAAAFWILFFYLPMTGLRYLKYRWWGQRQQATTSARGWFGWWPTLAGMALCSLGALFVVAMAMTGTNGERDQVNRYVQANQAALNEHNSLENFAGYAAATAINVYSGDAITPVIDGVNHLVTSDKLEQNIAAAQAYEQSLASTRQNDGGVIGMAILIFLIPLFYVGWNVARWLKRGALTTTILIAWFFLSASLHAQQPTGIVLENTWMSPMHGGATAMKELASLLSPFAKPSANLTGSPDLEIYEGVTYLMSLSEAKQKLNLGPKLVPKSKIITAGFPKDSLFYYCFDGIFEGLFGKLYLITDKADQVVAVQLVSESPRRDQIDEIFKATDWSMYNFVTNRRKATSRLWADHTVYFQLRGTWRPYRSINGSNQPTGDENLIRLDSVLMDPALSRSGFRTQGWRLLETSRLYMPKPLIELILHYLNTLGAK